MTDRNVREPFDVPVKRFAPAGRSDAGVVVLPAMGARARVYETFGAALAERGMDAAVVEGRGHGESPLRASRRVDWGYRDLIADLGGVLDRMREELPAGRPLIVAGHSLGGQLAAAATAVLPDGAFDGIALVAAGSPWHGHFPPKISRRLRLAGVIGPPLLALVGHWPGKRLGFGGREARTLTRDWLQLAVHGRFRLAGGPPGETGLEGRMADWRGPLLAIVLDRDRFAPEASVRGLAAKLESASLTFLRLGEDDAGPATTHFGWARAPDDVADTVVSWIRENVPASA